MTLFSRVQSALGRLHITWQVLTGKVRVDSENGELVCGMQHPAAGQIIVDAQQHEEFRKAAAELMFIRGFVAHVEGKKYDEAVEKNVR